MGVSYKHTLPEALKLVKKHKIKVSPCFSFLDVIHVNEHSRSEETTTPSNQIGTF